MNISMSFDDPINFLYVCVSFPPIIDPCSFRAFEISKRLLKSNIHPIVLTREYSTLNPKDLELMKKIPDSLSIHRTRTINIFKGILQNYFHWIPSAYYQGKKIIKKEQDLRFIFATSPSFYSLIIGYLLKIKSNLPLIIEYRDPWGYNPYNIKNKSNLSTKLNLLIEKRILKKADIIFTISSALKTFLLTKFREVQKKPIFTIENGLNITIDNSNLSSEDDKISIVFAGSLYGKRSIIPFFKIINILKSEGVLSDDDFQTKIFGSYDKNMLNNSMRKFGINENIMLGDYLSKSQVIEQVQRCSMALHVGENLDYPTISMKVWDYIGCGKKILYLGLENSYTAKFLIENDFGYVLPIDDLNKAKERLKKIIYDMKRGALNIDIDVNKLKNFTWDRKTNKFKEIIFLLKNKYKF